MCHVHNLASFIFISMKVTVHVFILKIKEMHSRHRQLSLGVLNSAAEPVQLPGNWLRDFDGGIWALKWYLLLFRASNQPHSQGTHVDPGNEVPARTIASFPDSQYVPKFQRRCRCLRDVYFCYAEMKSAVNPGRRLLKGDQRSC